MVMAVRDRPRHQQSSYCPCCDRQFNSLERPRDNTDRAKVTVPPSSHPCQTVCHDVPGEDNLDWSTDVRPEVKFASLVQFISCHSCNGRHRNPPYDNMYNEEKTNDVLLYGALLRLMGDMFQHRYNPDHR